MKGHSLRRKNLGRRGEDLALSYLTGKGYRFVDRNVSCPFGEIDLIVKDGKTLVFVEVKTRWSERYGPPEEAVTPRKLHSITRTALWFCQKNPLLPKLMRIDVVTLDADKFDELRVKRHIRNVTG